MNPYTLYPQPSQSIPYYQQQRTTYPVQSNGITWVQGIEGAKAYQMTPNSIMQLMDSENDGIFYIKVSDNIGMTSVRVFQYKEVEATHKEDPASIDLSQYVRKDELHDLIAGVIGKQEDRNEQSVSTTQSSKHKPTVQ